MCEQHLQMIAVITYFSPNFTSNIMQINEIMPLPRPEIIRKRFQET